MKTIIQLIIASCCITMSLAQNDTIKNAHEVHTTVRYLSMGRSHFGVPNYPISTNYTEWSNSIAATISYESPELKGWKLRAQLVAAQPFWEGGNCDCDAQQSLANDEMNILNKLSLNYSFSFFKRDAELNIGRIDLNSPFTPTYNIRQKDQSYEALELLMRPGENSTLSIGHIHRFSNWKPNAAFVNISALHGTNYHVTGLQYWNFTTTGKIGKDTVSLNVYQVYGHQLYNTFGLHLDWTFFDNNTSQIMVVTRLVNQLPSKRYAEFSGAKMMNVVQLGLDWSTQNLTVGSGIYLSPGGDPLIAMNTPFQANDLFVKEPLYEIDIGTRGGSSSFFIEASYNIPQNRKGKVREHAFYSLYFRTYHVSPKGYTEEVDLIYNHQLTDHFSTAIKVGLATSTLENDLKNHVFDGRLFFTYTL